MNALLLIAGPTCAGKTTLARRLARGELPHVARAAGLDAGEWVHRQYWQLAGRPLPRADRLAVQLDVLRPWKRGDRRAFAHDPILAALLAGRADVRVLSLHAPRAVLIERLRARTPRTIARVLATSGLAAAVRKRRAFRRLERLYASPDVDLDALLRPWHAFAGSIATRGHWRVDSGDLRCLLRPAPTGDGRPVTPRETEANPRCASSAPSPCSSSPPSRRPAPAS